MWTPEEQKKLDELLLKYPPEPVDAWRNKKIAAALGTRTEKQVNSRLQKYFQKLHKAGLPVPGRTPKSIICQKKNKHKHNVGKPTTFFPEYNVSVHMDDSESAPGPSNLEKPSSSTASNYLMPMEYYQKDVKEEVTEKSEIELQLELLKRIKAEKEKEAEMTEPYRHLTFKCDYCSEEPILGTRWHCSSCIRESIDFCTDCMVAQLYSENRHPLGHKFVTLPDDPSCNMSSDSDSDSTNETSNNNDVSDSDVSVHSSFLSLKSKRVSSSNGSLHPFAEKNGLRKNTENSNNYEVDRYLNELMYTEVKNVNMCSTQDLAYSYLHSNLSLNE